MQNSLIALIFFGASLSNAEGIQDMLRQHIQNAGSELSCDERYQSPLAKVSVRNTSFNRELQRHLNNKAKDGMESLLSYLPIPDFEAIDIPEKCQEQRFVGLSSIVPELPIDIKMVDDEICLLADTKNIPLNKKPPVSMHLEDISIRDVKFGKIDVNCRDDNKKTCFIKAELENLIFQTQIRLRYKNNGFAFGTLSPMRLKVDSKPKARAYVSLSIGIDPSKQGSEMIFLVPGSFRFHLPNESYLKEYNLDEIDLDSFVEKELYLRAFQIANHRSPENELEFVFSKEKRQELIDTTVKPLILAEGISNYKNRLYRDLEDVAKYQNSSIVLFRLILNEGIRLLRKEETKNKILNISGDAIGEVLESFIREFISSIPAINQPGSIALNLPNLSDLLFEEYWVQDIETHRQQLVELFNLNQNTLNTVLGKLTESKKINKDIRNYQREIRKIFGNTQEFGSDLLRRAESKSFNLNLQEQYLGMARSWKDIQRQMILLSNAFYQPENINASFSSNRSLGIRSRRSYDGLDKLNAKIDKVEKLAEGYSSYANYLTEEELLEGQRVLFQLHSASLINDSSTELNIKGCFADHSDNVNPVDFSKEAPYERSCLNSPDFAVQMDISFINNYLKKLWERKFFTLCLPTSKDPENPVQGMCHHLKNRDADKNWIQFKNAPKIKYNEDNNSHYLSIKGLERCGNQFFGGCETIMDTTYIHCNLNGFLRPAVSDLDEDMEKGILYYAISKQDGSRKPISSAFACEGKGNFIQNSGIFRIRGIGDLFKKAFGIATGGMGFAAQGLFSLLHTGIQNNVLQSNMDLFESRAFSWLDRVNNVVPKEIISESGKITVIGTLEKLEKPEDIAILSEKEIACFNRRSEETRHDHSSDN